MTAQFPRELGGGEKQRRLGQGRLPNAPRHDLRSTRMGIRRLTTLASLCAAACSGRVTAEPRSDAPKEGTYQSGARLRAHVFDAGHGATMFIDWRDTLFDVPCRFFLDEMGAARCLPLNSRSAAWSYLDDACTQRALVTSVPAAQPSYVGLPVSEGCTSHAVIRVYAIAREGSPARTAYQVTNQVCAPVALAPDEQILPLTIADPSLFVAARPSIESRATGVDVETLVADDGSRQIDRLWDHQRQARCSVLRTGPDETTDWSCIAAPAMFETLGFSDAACTQTMRAVQECAPRADCGTPGPPTTPRPIEYVALPNFSSTTCDTIYEVRALGPEVAAHYDLSSGQCAPSSSQCSFHPVMSLVDTTALPRAISGRLGTGAVKKLAFHTSGDSRVAADQYGFWDAGQGAGCRPVLFADQVIRCVAEETTAPLLDSFADANCTQPLVDADVCGTAPLFATELDDGDSTGSLRTKRMFAVGDRFQGAMYSHDVTGACIPMADSSTPAWKTLGQELDPDLFFPRLTERTDL